MKSYHFKIDVTSIGLGFVNAESIEEAKEKIANHDWDDIYDEVGTEYGELIDIEEEQ